MKRASREQMWRTMRSPSCVFPKRGILSRVIRITQRRFAATFSGENCTCRRLGENARMESNESGKRTDEIYDAIVIGGGPAGSIGALNLAQRGRKVIVLERAT